MCGVFYREYSLFMIRTIFHATRMTRASEFLALNLAPTFGTHLDVYCIYEQLYFLIRTQVSKVILHFIHIFVDIQCTLYEYCTYSIL